MTGQLEDYTAALDRAMEHARQWIGSLGDRQAAPELDEAGIGRKQGTILTWRGVQSQ
jgi:hypothetical protein